MIKNTEKSFGSVARLFHWGMFLLFVVQFIGAEIMDDMSKTETLLGFGKYDLYGVHKSIGVLLLAFVFMRLAWKLSNPTPVYPGWMNKMQKLAADAGHWGLYVIMFAMPITGYVMSMAGGHGIKFFGLWNLPNFVGLNEELADVAHELHGVIADVMLVLVGVHIAAALYHHIVKKDDVLKRMKPFSKVE